MIGANIISAVHYLWCLQRHISAHVQTYFASLCWPRANYNRPYTNKSLPLLQALQVKLRNNFQLLVFKQSFNQSIMNSFDPCYFITKCGFKSWQNIRPLQYIKLQVNYDEIKATHFGHQITNSFDYTTFKFKVCRLRIDLWTCTAYDSV